MSYNYYKAKWTAVTAKRAKIMGVPVSRDYGYIVLIDPPVLDEGKIRGMERWAGWCKTKSIAENAIQRNIDSQQKGYYGCPCGNNKQARACCGIPNYDL